MKKFLLFILSSTLLLTACGGDSGGGGGDTPTSEFLNVSDVNIAGGNTTATLYVNASNNCDWIISWNDTWIRSINPTKGRGSQNVTVMVTVNPSSTAERTAVVTVRNASGTISRNITITQSPNAESMELSMSAMNFAYTIGSQDVSVTSNTHWKITGSASWMSLSKTEGDDNGSVTISVTENLTEEERSAVLSFTGSGGITKQLKVTQAGHPTNFSVSPTHITAEALMGTVQFNIVGDARWSAQSNRSWATLSDISGMGNKTITVTLGDNTTEEERTAEITVSSTSKAEKIVITQKAGTKPTVSNLQVTNITKTGASFTFSYTSLFPVTEYGVCYSSTNTSPTLNGSSRVSQSGSSKQDSPSMTITGLAAGTTYYVRAYAVSAVGTQYSNTVTFTTIGNWPGGGDNEPPHI